MTDYIKRSDIAERIDYYESHSVGGEHYAYEICAKEIRDVPNADVAPVVHGWWEETKYVGVSKCSCCGKYSRTPDSLKEFYDYCPNCGTKMDLE